MFTSFSTALSALSAHSTAIDVVGNNLANLNTPGFKANVVAFHDLVTQSLGAGLGETQVGFGVSRPTTIREFTQGSIQSSSGSLDCAIQGDGFLMVQDNLSNTLFTRGGNLQVDKSGNLLTSTGQRVQGWTQSAAGVLSTNQPVSDIVVPVGNLQPPSATTSFSWDANLNASAKVGDEFSASIEVFDSLGVSHVVSAKFKKTDVNQWEGSLTIPDATQVTTDPDPVVLTFGLDAQGHDGVLIQPASTDPMPTVTASFGDGAQDLKVTWELFNSGAPRLTQFAQPSATSANAQNGYPAAQLVKVGIGDGGQVLAQYSNGKQEIVAQLAMAAIRNPESMIAVGNNNFQLSSATALPALGLPSTGGRGTILGGSIEYSTVDIAREFTNLIVFQRGYQANARVITTVDELSTETINLKR